MSSLFLFFLKSLPPFCNKSLTRQSFLSTHLLANPLEPWRSTKNWRSSAMSRPVAVPSSRPGSSLETSSSSSSDPLEGSERRGNQSAWLL